MCGGFVIIDVSGASESRDQRVWVRNGSLFRPATRVSLDGMTPFGPFYSRQGIPEPQALACVVGLYLGAGVHLFNYLVCIASGDFATLETSPAQRAI